MLVGIERHVEIGNAREPVALERGRERADGELHALADLLSSALPRLTTAISNPSAERWIASTTRSVARSVNAA